jgi:hypothetical protein
MKLKPDEVIQALRMMADHVGGNSMQLKLLGIDKKWSVEEVLDDLKKIIRIVKREDN